MDACRAGQDLQTQSAPLIGQETHQLEREQANRSTHRAGQEEQDSSYPCAGVAGPDGSGSSESSGSSPNEQERDVGRDLGMRAWSCR